MTPARFWLYFEHLSIVPSEQESWTHAGAREWVQPKEARWQIMENSREAADKNRWKTVDKRDKESGQ